MTEAVLRGVDGENRMKEGGPKMRRIARIVPLIAVTAVVAALALAPAAFGANASVKTYAGSGGNTQSQIQGGQSGPTSGPTDPAAPSAKATGALPFTGSDLSLAIGGAVLLLVGGASMAALASRSQRD
jgi:hypothetical protein